MKFVIEFCRRKLIEKCPKILIWTMDFKSIDKKQNSKGVKCKTIIQKIVYALLKSILGELVIE